MMPMIQASSDAPSVLPQKRSHASSSSQQPDVHQDDSLEAGLERLMDEMDHGHETDCSFETLDLFQTQRAMIEKSSKR